MDERILRRLKLSDLRLFRTVVDSGGMAKAASNLNISQSAVSKAITALEQALRVRLLDRTPSGVAPTPYGEALLRRAHAIFDELQQSINEIEYLSDPNMGELRFGATEPLMDNFVPAIIDRLLRSYSRMRFRVSHLHSVEYQQRELRERNVELVVSRINASEMAPDMHSEILFDDPIYATAGVNSSWARRRSVRLSELTKAVWILPPLNSVVGSLISKSFAVRGLELPQGIICHSVQVSKALLQTGGYLAVLPSSMLRLGAERHSLIGLIKLSDQPAPVGIITLKNRTPHPLARLFVQTAGEIAKGLPRSHDPSVIGGKGDIGQSVQHVARDP